MMNLATPADASDAGPEVPLSRALAARLVEIRRELHRHPELSNQEFETTARLRGWLEAAGVGPVRPLGPTGLVVDVAGDPSGPTVVVRGDIDALPLEEQTGLPFSSENAGVMHACGHDVHATIALGVALAAAEHGALPGTLRVILQPAEEAEPLGGRRVVADGHLDGVAAAIALHVDPELPVGRVGLRAGASMSSSDEFAIVVRGASAHAGWPHVGRDAIAAAASVVQAVQSIVARRTDPRSPVTINLGRISGGTAPNIIAEEVRIAGTIRTLDEALRPVLREQLRDAVAHAAAAVGASATVELIEGEPVLENAPAVIDAFAAAARDAIGPEACHRQEQPTMNSEDFSFYTQALPSAIAWIGARDEQCDAVHPLHDPRIVLDERVIPLGVRLLLDTAVRLLRQPPAPR